MSLKSIKRRIKALEDVLITRVIENPFGEKTKEALLQVYITELGRLISEERLIFPEFLTMTELEERLANLQLPPVLRRDINHEMNNGGIMSDDTLKALTERLYT